ncbi:MAG: hypothetical protein WAW79_09965 [Steroidobacteraceae bacterium]
MPKKTLLLVSGLSILALVTSCKRGPEADPQATTGPDPTPVDLVEPATPCGAGDGPAVAGVGKIRITLNGDGTVGQIEGTDAGGNFEPILEQQEATPASLGECLTTIQVNDLNDSTEDLMGAEGESLHSNAAQSNPPYNTHCHRWVKINNVNYLVHC